MTLDTVPTPTPAFLATSRIVAVVIIYQLTNATPFTSILNMAHKKVSAVNLGVEPVPIRNMILYDNR
jgi:hypothetical protein